MFNETYDTKMDRMLSTLPANIDKREGSVAWDLLAPVALELAQQENDKENLINWAFLLGEHTPSELIDKRVKDWGLSRKPGAKATGSVNVTGPNGTFIPIGATFETADGFVYKSTAAVTLTTGSGTVLVEADRIGANYNIADNRLVKSDITFTSMTHTAIEGGANVESDEALLARYLEFVQKPSTSGNANHYVSWAKSVSGVGAAFCTPIWNGPGTVRVVIASDTNRAPSAQTLTAVTKYIESQRPIGAAVTVLGATEKMINVSATVTVSAGTNRAQVQAELSAALDKYFTNIAFKDTAARINAIGGLIMAITGVTDYSGLTLNGSAANVSLAATEIPIKGTVTAL
jgi:uncharacterized phage protein gp47/JayE